MLSSQRILVVTATTVTVYDLPQANRMPESPISPIWKWPTQEPLGVPANLRCDALSYSSLSTQPIIWIFASSNWLHRLDLSDSEDPVGQHFVFSMKYFGMPAVDSSRALWMMPVGNVAMISTIRLQNPPTQEPFEIRVEPEEGNFESGCSFDETSGRVALVLKKPNTGECYVYVSSIARLEMFKHGC